MTLQGPAQWDQVRQDIRREGVRVWAAEREVSEKVRLVLTVRTCQTYSPGAGRHCEEARPREKVAGARRQAAPPSPSPSQSALPLSPQRSTTQQHAVHT